RRPLCRCQGGRCRRRCWRTGNDPAGRDRDRRRRYRQAGRCRCAAVDARIEAFRPGHHGRRRQPSPADGLHRPAMYRAAALRSLGPGPAAGFCHAEHQAGRCAFRAHFRDLRDDGEAQMKHLPIALVAVLAAMPAAAQDLQYGKLEQLFGEPVTASATGEPLRASDAPVDMEIVTQEDIRRSGAVDIPGALRFVTGIDERVYGANHAEVGIRGYNQPQNPRLLVLLNGRQVYLDDYGEVDWKSIPVQLSEIRQIEVVKGPNSALYGFNAAYGVINIITYDPLEDHLSVANLTFGMPNEIDGSLAKIVPL